MARRQMTFLLTVAEERSVGRAAERLGVATDDVVAELKALERDLGAAVLHRAEAGLRLTPAGRTYLEHAVLQPDADDDHEPAAASSSEPDMPVVDPFGSTDADVERTTETDSEADGGPDGGPEDELVPGGPSRRAVLLGAGAMGLVAAGAAALGMRPGHASAPAGAGTAEAEVRTLAQAITRTAAAAGANVIRAENAKPGSPGWVLAGDDHTPRAIEGFSDVPGGRHGRPVRLFVRSRTATFVVEAYRLGWYGGVKARLVWTSGPVEGGPQPSPTIDADTNMVDCADWSPSLTFTPDESWLHGQYLLKLVQPDGKASYIPFVLRSPAEHAEVLVVAGVTTGAAYETWGGHSLYAGLDGGISERADVVSLDRPFGTGYGGAGWLLGGSSEIAQLLEAQGVDVAYATNLDQHADPGVMRRCNVIISSSHDEYYSMEMRLGLQAAVDAGVNVIYLGANALYRKIRFEDSPIGPARRIVNYRSAGTDPETRDNLVTTNWREGPSPLPESTLTANWYESNQPGLRADIRFVDGPTWLFQGTGLAAGSTIADGVREEWDRVRPGKPLPRQLQIVAHSPFRVRGKPTASDMTYATFPSGAAAFNVGTLRFQQRLGPLSPPLQGGDDGAVRRLVWNVVDAFRTGPAGRRHPAVRNVEAIYPDGGDDPDVGSDPSA